MGSSNSPFKLMLLVAMVIGAATVVMGAFGGPSDRVLLSDVNVLTLYKNRMTSGRRSSPVPQLNCVGGTAKGLFNPEVVQCYNRGWDGNDVQWECKTDMDNAFRFGSVEVTCEGYDHPDDPYILKGSCGLDYTLELTEEGYQRYRHQKSHSYSDQYSSHHYSGPSWGQKGKSVVGDLLFLGGIAVVIYVIYKSCLSSAATGGTPGDNTRGANPAGAPPPYSPPPYGFRDEYMPGSDSCGSSYQQGTNRSHNTHTQGATGGAGGGGFWSGAATGGLLGYLFGRNNGGGYTHYQQPHHGWGQGYGGRNRGWFSGWGSSGGFGGARTGYGGGSSFFSGGGGGGSSVGGGGSSASSGTRTASGFGGTRRR